MKLNKIEISFKFEVEHGSQQRKSLLNEQIWQITQVALCSTQSTEMSATKKNW